MNPVIRSVIFGGAPASPPATPTGLVATGGTGSVVLTWINPGGITSWDVEISSDGGSTWGSPINVLVATYTDASATSNVQVSTGQVYYRIRANNAGGSSEFTDGTAHASPWLIQDVFTDTNGTNLSSHTIGPVNTPATAWALPASWDTGLGATWKIQSNQSQGLGATGNGQPVVIDAGQANVTISAVFTWDSSMSGKQLGLQARQGTGLNGWQLVRDTNNIQIWEVATTFTQRATAAVTWGATDTVTLVISGTTITGYVNGVQKITYGSASSGSSNMKHGIYGYKVTADLADNFKLTSP